MKLNLKQKWIEALRSGKYDQTCGKLRDSYGFDAFGILCDVMKPQGWSRMNEKWTHPFDSGSGTDLSIDFLQAHNITLTEEQTLIEMSDNGKSFTEIADWIEDRIDGDRD